MQDESLMAMVRLEAEPLSYWICTSDGNDKSKWRTSEKHPELPLIDILTTLERRKLLTFQENVILVGLSLSPQGQPLQKRRRGLDADFRREHPALLPVTANDQPSRGS